MSREWAAEIPLILMNSFFTHVPSMEIVGKSRLPVHTFIQREAPRLLANTLEPLDTGTEEDWTPPGHGDVYFSFRSSGLLEKMLTQGRRWAFISNLDNLAACVEPWILGLIDRDAIELLLEVTPRTNVDRKGGTLVAKNGRLDLLEIAQVAPEDRTAFMDIRRFRVFNTNNVWVDLKALDLPGKTFRCIVDGPDRNWGDWDHIRTDKGELDHSEIDWYILSSLVSAGMSDEKIELVYATFPVGEGCYQNVRRKGSYGSAYLTRSLMRTREKSDAEAKAAQTATGVNFEVVDVVRVLASPPYYNLSIKCPDDEIRIVRNVSTDDLFNELLLKKAIHSQTNFVPEVQAAHKARGIELLAQAISTMARIEAPVSGSTELDYIRAVIIEHLRGGKVHQSKPEDMGNVAIGWRDDEFGIMYVRSAALVQIVAASFRGASPKPEKIWESLRPYGCDEETMLDQIGRPTKLWKIPLIVVDRGG